MNTTLTLTQEWDKVFPLSEKVNHKKVTFKTQYGLTLAADMYIPASSDPSKGRGEKMAAIAVSGPFGAVKEQASGLYAMKMAERGFVALADGYRFVGEPNPNPGNKQLLIIPDASHCDLYDGGYTALEGHGQPKNMIPWDTVADFFKEHMK